MSEKKMVKETIEEREYVHLTEAIQALTRFNYAGLNADLIEHMDGWKVVLFKWVEEYDNPKPFITGGYIDAKALTELRADEQVINFEKIKEEALRQYGKEVEKEVANLARETYENLYKEERDAFIKSVQPKYHQHGGVIATEVEDEPQQIKVNGNGFEVTGTGADFEQWIGELIDKKVAEKEEDETESDVPFELMVRAYKASKKDAEGLAMNEGEFAAMRYADDQVVLEAMKEWQLNAENHKNGIISESYMNEQDRRLSEAIHKFGRSKE